jgi:hypothetical protein
MTLAANKLLATTALKGHNKENTVAKAKKLVTAKRQVFLDALAIIRKHGQDNDIDFLKASSELLKLVGNAPRSGWLAEEWAICSALWASQLPTELPEIERIHEHCVGGQMFLVAYRLGVLSAQRNQLKSK